jgi:hypothetical protein
LAQGLRAKCLGLHWKRVGSREPRKTAEEDQALAAAKGDVGRENCGKAAPVKQEGGPRPVALKGFASREGNGRKGEVQLEK